MNYWNYKNIYSSRTIHTQRFLPLNVKVFISDAKRRNTSLLPTVFLSLYQLMAEFKNHSVYVL